MLCLASHFKTISSISQHQVQDIMDGCDRCSTNLASWYHTNQYVSYGGEGILKRFLDQCRKMMETQTTSKLRDLQNQLGLVKEIKSRRLGRLKNLVRIQVAREGSREDLGKVGSMMWRMTLDMWGTEDGGQKTSWHSSGQWRSERLRSYTNLNATEWINTKVWSWWPNFNLGITISHPQIRDYIVIIKDWLSHFNLWVMVLALKACKAGPAGPCYYNNAMKASKGLVN